MLTSSSGLSISPSVRRNSQLESNLSSTANQEPQLNQVKKSPYQVAQQVKFLHLEAEIESLLQQLKTLNQQRTACTVGEGRE